MKSKLLGWMLLSTLVMAPSAWAQDEGLRRFREIRGEAKLREQLSAVVDVAMRRAWDESVPWPPGLDPVFEQPLGLFVTLKRKGEIRGCMGSLKPRLSSLREEIAANLRAALFRDPRHRRVEKSELEGMEIYLTTTGTPQAVPRFDALSPKRDAILLKSGAKEAVVLPGEARTLRYLLAFAKAKAGIRKGESYQVYRLPVEILSVDQSSEPVSAPALRPMSSPASSMSSSRSRSAVIVGLP